MRVLFLDFDGVLNSHTFLYETTRDREGIERAGNEHMELDPVAIGRLNQILDRTGAKIVVSSSWRHGHSAERLQEILRAAGCTGEVIDVTPDGTAIPESVRGHEIDQWLQEHPEVVRFVIVDDDSDMAHLHPHLVQTTWAKGLLDEHVERIVSRFLADPVYS